MVVPTLEVAGEATAVPARRRITRPGPGFAVPLAEEGARRVNEHLIDDVELWDSMEEQSRRLR
eukprot:1390407-Heterocapsa_arctica.AAC.1